jgi:glycosyltransferase involved in cell wall biosynthesis
MKRVAMFVLNDMRLDSRVHREAGTLGAAGYDVTVYAVMSQATAHVPREEADGFAIVRVPMLMRPATEVPGAAPGTAPQRRAGRAALASVFVATRPLFGGALHYLANWQLRWNSWARRVDALVEPADVWHAHDFNTLGLAVACARRYGGSIVYDSHEIFTEAGANAALPGTVRAAMRNRERAWASHASAVLTVNESLADVLRTQLGVEVTVVRNCSVPPPPGVSPLRDAIGVGSEVPVVIYHGSVTVGRGIEPLIASVADDRLRNAHLVIMGYGPLRPAMQALAEASQARDRIHLLPPVPPGDVTRWVAGADVAAMPIEPTTLNHRLSSPNKLFEAIAAGVPVVGPDFAEFRRFVRDAPGGPLGRLHADHLPQSIATEVHALLALSPTDRLELRARCQAAARARWNWEAESRHLLNAYASLVPARAAVERRRVIGRGRVLPATDE